MGVDTVGIVQGGLTAGDIEAAIKRRLAVVPKMRDTAYKNYWTSSFEYKDENRELSLHLDYPNVHEHPCLSEDVNEITLITCGAWGHSIEIIENIVKEFGGHILERDSNDDYRKVLKQYPNMEEKEKAIRNTLLVYGYESADWEDGRLKGYLHDDQKDFVQLNWTPLINFSVKTESGIYHPDIADDYLAEFQEVLDQAKHLNDIVKGGE